MGVNEESSLRRALKFVHFLAASMGTPMASSVFLSIILMALVARDGTDLLLSIVLSTVIVSLVALAYGELVSVHPTAAGNRVFLQPLVGNRLAITLSLVWIAALMGGAGVEAFIFGEVLNFLYPALPVFLYVALGLGLIMLVNIVGVEVSGRFQSVLSFTVASALVALSVYALSLSGVGRLTFGPPNALRIFVSSSISVYFFLGFARVTTLGEEAEDYRRALPLSMPTGVLLLGLVFGLVSLAFLKVEPLNVLSNTYVPQILLGKYLLGERLAVVAALLSLLMSFGAFNAGLLGTSRLIYALGREGVLPKVLGSISPRFLTPVRSIITLYFIVLGVAGYILLTKDFSLTLLLAAAVDSVLYALVALSAFKHLRTYRAEDIPFRPRGGAVLFPLVAALFFLFGGLIFATSSPYLVLATLVLFGLLYFSVMVRLRKPA
ncbi:MAG: APC family permease [Thermoprotei archaeon]